MSAVEKMTLGLHPFVLIAAVALLGAALAAVLAYQVSSWRKRIVLIMVTLVLATPTALVCVALKPELVDGRFRAYQRLYRDIEVGMTRAEVMQLVDQQYPADGKRARPKVWEDTDTQLCLFMNPERRTEPSCEGIFLTLSEERITAKEYSRD